MAPPKSKTLATWLALLGGPLGLHRFYLHGLRDWAGWLLPLPTLLGAIGVQRMRAFGIDDRLAWLLVPLLGFTIAGTCFAAIVHGLTADEKWNARHNAGAPPSRTFWATILAVVFALMIGAGTLMATIAFVGQHAFELALGR